jgi:hypothetical protein
MGCARCLARSIEYPLWELLQDTALKVLGGEVKARDLADGLPRCFLAGEIVEVWLALHLNWA